MFRIRIPAQLIRLQDFQNKKIQKLFTWKASELQDSSARIYRPAFSWKQAQNARIHLIENERFGWFSRKQGL